MAQLKSGSTVASSAIITASALAVTTDGSSGADQVGATATTNGTATTVQGILEEIRTVADAAMPKGGGTFTGDVEAHTSSSMTSELVRNSVLLAVGASSSGVQNNTFIFRY